MTRAEYENKILRVAARIEERREIQATADAYVKAKQRMAAGTANMFEEMYVEQLEEWANRPTLLELLTRSDR